MTNLVDVLGRIEFGIYDHPIDHVNYLDYRLESPMGLPLPGLLKRIMVNQFLFLGAISHDLMIGMAIVDLKYLTDGFFYIYDRRDRTFRETKRLAPPGPWTSIAPYPDRNQGRFDFGDLHIHISGGAFAARGKDISFEGKVDLTDSQPLRICTRAGYRGWTYTQKTTPLALRGEARLRGQTIPLSSPSAMALVDWTCGYMRRNTFWNWAAIASTLPDGRPLGLNLSCGVNETSFTENALWLGGKMTKIDTVSFREGSGEWQIRSRDGRVDLTFRPEAQRQEKINALALASRFTQMMGSFQGHLITAGGEDLTIEGCPGLVEDHYARW